MRKTYPFNWSIPQLDKKRCSKQIEEFIIFNITAKNLRSGDMIPGYRTLAEINDVGLNSVRRAYMRLISSRWLETRGGSGTFVSDRSLEPNVYPERTSNDDFIVRLQPSIQEHKVRDTPAFAFVGTDFPNPFLFPEDRFYKYCHKHRVGSAKFSQSELLFGYGGNYLKQIVVDDLNKQRGFGVNKEILRVINGREESLRRVFKALVMPGELVINTGSYDPLIDLILRDIGAAALRLNSIHPEFITKLESLLVELKIRAIYIRPQSSFPENHTLSVSDCKRLIELAKIYGVNIIEEDDDHEFWLGNIPYKALVCYDHGGFVIYLGALSKARSDMQSLRVVVASRYLIKLMDSFAETAFENRDVIEEKAFADLILNGDLDEYRRNVRLTARKNRDALDMILQNYLGAYISYTLPAHGLTFWLHFADRFDLNLVLKDLEDMGIAVPYHPKHKQSNGKCNDMLLGYGAFDINEAEGAAKLLEVILKKYDGKE
jgi:GntR family transcriptional regulator/MocR family aminotransferase